MQFWLLAKSIFFTILIPGSVAGWIPVMLGGAFPGWGPWQFCGSVFLAFGTSVLLWTIADFFSAGRGTLSPVDPPKELVVRGLYRYSRNPMYVGALIANIGLALLFESWLVLGYAGLVVLFQHLFVLLYEEPTLKRLFGPRYLDYQARTPRWLIGR